MNHCTLCHGYTKFFKYCIWEYYEKKIVFPFVKKGIIFEDVLVH